MTLRRIYLTGRFDKVFPFCILIGMNLSKTSIDTTLQEIVRKISAIPEVEKIILFGSYAYSKPTKDSDIDLLIISQFVPSRD
jgi:predicted nucleotidyltransferase